VPDGQAAAVAASGDIVALIPLVRRVVAARARDPHQVEDLVQETLIRLMSARSRLEPHALGPYAVVVARNLVAAAASTDARARRNAHRLLDRTDPARPEDETLQREEATAMAAALTRLSDRERDALVAHEVDGRGTGSLASAVGATPGAVAAQLHRTRARLRVEYLLALERIEPPTPRCRPVLLALSAGDRRRQRELDTGGHLLECRCCAALGEALFERRPAGRAEPAINIPIESDIDVVRARQKGREVAAGLGFPATDLTLTATAISEIARNILRFAGRGVLTVEVAEADGRQGVTIIARDAGPGIEDIGRALDDGYSTCNGFGLGLSGARRLMDEFEITSEVGRGTTVTMTKWRAAGAGRS
jgi:RNA polymerase sigma factor (sigma-70 family)